MRKISRDVEKRILKLWLEGHTYRKISPRCGGVSLATISKIVDGARKRAPDIDELRHLNVALKRGSRSVYDAMRGGRLLDKVTQLGVGLDDLEDYIKTAQRISSEREAEAERFVDSTIRLIRLEAEAGKTYGEIIKDFEGRLSETANLEVKIGTRRDELKALGVDYREKKAVLEEEIKRLKQETVKVKEILEGQGLSWEVGIKILKEVTNLRAERKSLKDEVARQKAEVSDWRAKEKRARSTLLQLKTQLGDLRGTMKREEGWFHNLLGQISSAQNRLYTIKEKERDLWESVKAYEDVIVIHEQKERIASLQAEMQNLKAEIERLSAAEEFVTGKVNHLRAEMETLQSKREEQIKKAKELAEKIASDAEQERKRISTEVQEEKEKILQEVKVLRKEKQKLEAKIKEEREKLVEEASGRAKKIVEDAEQKKEKILQEVEVLRKELQKIIDDAEMEKKKILKEAEEETRTVLAGAKEEKEKILGEVEELRKKKEKLKAEEALLETAIRRRIEELREERKRLDMEEIEQVSEDTAFGSLLRLPKLPPLTVKKKERA